VEAAVVEAEAPLVVAALIAGPLEVVVLGLVDEVIPLLGTLLRAPLLDDGVPLDGGVLLDGEALAPAVWREPILPDIP